LKCLYQVRKVWPLFIEVPVSSQESVTTFYWSACIKPGKCDHFLLKCLYSARNVWPLFIEVPVLSQESERSCIFVWYGCHFSLFLQFFYWILELFRQCGIFFFILFQIQNEWTHFTTMQFYTKHTGHPLITNSCDVQLQFEQYWYHRLSKWPRPQTGNCFDSNTSNVFYFRKWTLTPAYITRKI